MHLRFSLRTVFVLVTIVAGASYWFMLPTIYARGFVNAVAAADYERADEYFRNPDDRLLCEQNGKYWRFIARAKLESSSFGALLRGRRRVTLTVMFHDAGPLRTQEWTVSVTRAGLLTPQPVLRRSGGFGGGGLAGRIDHPLHTGSILPF
jgi:hypothetical protein